MAKTATATKPAPAKGKPETSSALVRKEPNNGALAHSAEIDKLLLQDQGAGTEGMGPQDLQIPRISILQSGSPQVKKSDGAHIKGAEEGDFYDNVANAVYAKGEEGFFFIPVARRRAHIEWIPKNDGGGFVTDHGSNDAILQQATKDSLNRMMLKNGHEIVTTQEYYVIILAKDGSNPKQAVISMAKTQLKKARKLNTVLSSLLVDRPSGGGKFNPAIFFSVFHATTVPESNDKGNWMGWLCPRQGDTLALENGENLYLMARQFREAVGAGSVKVAAPADAGAAAADTGSPEDGETL